MMNWLKSLFSSPPAELVLSHRLARRNFTYVKQPGERRSVTKANISKPFTGDCDDFAWAVAHSVKGTYIEFLLPSGELHAACLYKGWVSDNKYKEPYKLKQKVLYSAPLPQRSLTTTDSVCGKPLGRS